MSLSQRTENEPRKQAGVSLGTMEHLKFNRDGLLPVVVQCVQSGRVLMLAWMNKQSVEETLISRYMVYYSRSRRCLWKKGETSGCWQRLHTLFTDCDADALLARVWQNGVACHTGRRSCFYDRIDGQA